MESLSASATGLGAVVTEAKQALHPAARRGTSRWSVKI